LFVPSVSNLPSNGTGLSVSGNTLNVSGLTTSEFATTSISQWANDAGYITSAVNDYDWIVNGTDLYASSTFTKVGIGTIAPSTTLHVVGDFKVSATSSFLGYVGVGSSTAPTDQFTLFGGNFVQTADQDPTLEGRLDTDGTNKVYVSGKYAYLADGFSGIRIADISDPANPTTTATLATSGAFGLYTSGRYLYIADFNSGLRIVDISNPADPINLDNLSTTDAGSVYVSGKYAYVGDNASGLRIIDVSDPLNLILISTLDTTDANDVYVKGEYAYVADGSAGLRIINISDPENPNLASTLDTQNAKEVYVSGKYAYVADGSAGLRIIDISDPTSPSITGTLDTYDAFSVYVSGKYAYVADDSEGLRIINILTPTSPVLVATLDTTNSRDVFVSGKYAYVADDTDGLRIIDINGIDSPAASIGNIAANDITVWENIDIGNNLYVRNGINVGSGGLLANGAISIGGFASSTDGVQDAVLYIASSTPATTTYGLYNVGGTLTWNGTGLGADGVGITAINDLTNATTSILGTSNQVTVASSGTNIITFSLPQDIHTSATPTFSTLALTSLLISGDTINDFNGTGLSVSGNTLNVSGLTTSEFATTSISQWANDAGYITSAVNDYDWIVNGTDLYASSTFTKVGIGTIAPSTTLHVVGDFKVSATSTLLGNVGIGTENPSFPLSVVAPNSGRTAAQFEHIASGDIDVRINRSAVSKSGNLVFSTADSPAWYLGQPDSNDYSGDGTDFYIGTVEDTPKLLITSGGSVGINTNAPSTTFHVVGTGRYSGNLTLDSGLIISGDTITDFNGTGLSVDTNILNVADLTTSQFATTSISQWNNDSGYVTASSLLWTDGGDETYLAATSDDLLVGGSTTSTAAFWFDVSEELFNVGNATSGDSVLEFALDSSVLWSYRNYR